MALSRKHYECIAAILRRFPDKDGYPFEDMVAQFADYFKRDNPSFQSFEFVKACGLISEVKLTKEEQKKANAFIDDALLSLLADAEKASRS